MLKETFLLIKPSLDFSDGHVGKYGASIGCLTNDIYLIYGNKNLFVRQY